MLKEALQSLKSPSPAQAPTIEEPARLTHKPRKLTQQESILDHQDDLEEVKEKQVPESKVKSQPAADQSSTNKKSVHRTSKSGPDRKPI